MRRLSVVSGLAGGAEGGGEFEMDIFFGDDSFFQGGVVSRLEQIDDFADEIFRGAGSGGDQDGVDAIEPGVIEVRDVVDEESTLAAVAGDFGEAQGVGAVLAADDKDEVARGSELSDCHLAVGSGVADVLFDRAANAGVFLLEGGDDGFGVVKAEGGLGEVGDGLVVGDGQFLDVAGVFDDVDGIGGFAEGADDFVVAVMADEDDGELFAGVADGFGVNFHHERAGGVDLDEVAGAGLAADFGGDAVGAVDERGADGDIVDGVDKHDALLGEALDDVSIVDDFVVDVNGRAFEA